MAWTDTSNCSFCGKEIPIFRKFGNGQYCSKQHQEAFEQQQEQMAVALLHRTHDALKAYRPVGSSIEDILGTGPAKAPVPQYAAPAPVAALVAEVEAPPSPVYQAPLPQVPVAHVTRDDSREFDVASPAVFARLTGVPAEKPVDTQRLADAVRAAAPKVPAKPPLNSPVHFGESLAKLNPPKVPRKSLRSQLLAWVLHNWPWGQSQKA
ncbi:MAG: hypothetical protein ABIR70_09930 [Bryobacteraceae bacterium]